MSVKTKFRPLLLLLTSIAVVPTAVSQRVTFDDLFMLEKVVQIPQNDSILLGVRQASALTHRNEVIWAEDFGFRIFDDSGSLLRHVQRKGGGPGEFMSLSRMSHTKGGTLAFFDFYPKKIVLFSPKGDFLDEFRATAYRFKEIAIAPNGHVFTLNEIGEYGSTPAISEYTSKGVLVGHYGRVPIEATLMRDRNGGGIVVAPDGHVYYSFLGVHEIYKFNPKDKSIQVFSNKPDHFEGVDVKWLTSARRTTNELWSMSFRTTMVLGLFFLEPDILVQYMSTGLNSPAFMERFNRPQVNHMEVWRTDGTKIASGVVTDGWPLGSNHSNFIYFNNLTEYFEGKTEKINVHYYRLKNRN